MAADSPFTITTNSPDETQNLGRCLGASLTCGDVLALYGDLGSGKTCLVQGIAQGMEVLGRVSSPTFIIMRQHTPGSFGAALYHIDAYRLGDGDELWQMGLEDWLYNGAVVIEWAERVAEALPQDRLEVTLSGQGDERQVAFKANGPRSLRIMEYLQRCAC